MKLYDVGETIEEGLPISVLESEKRTYLNVGRVAEDTDLASILPFSRGLSALLLSADYELNVIKRPDVVMYEGAIAREDGVLCLEQVLTGKDDSAVVRAGLVHGVGGKIEYFLDEGVDIIAEGVLGVGTELFPVYVLVMLKGSSFHIHRTGDIYGLPAEITFTWDGKKITRNPA